MQPYTSKADRASATALSRGRRSCCTPHSTITWYNGYMDVSQAAIADLIQDPANVRTHSGKNIDAIKASLKRLGQQKPIVVSADNIVIAGNGTLAAAKALGWDTLDIHRTALKGPEAIAYAIADNRTAELADWDMDGLSAQLASLDDELRAVAFDDFEFPEPEPELDGTEDDIPETADNEMGVEKGDIWELGRHRIMCGDATDEGAVFLLTNRSNIDMVYTDPPYGMNAVEKSAVLSKRYKPVRNDHDTEVAKEVSTLVLQMDIPTVLWGANYYSSCLPDASCWLVWDKNNGGSDQVDCELAWTNLKGVVRQFTQSSEKTNRVHPTQKPVQLAVWCWERYDVGKSILDLFLGSGSTLIACEKTTRTCYGMELDPHYCSVVIKRWETLTGDKAKKVS
jgi:16S rRNA G966 N2-methylase RsmD